MSNTPDPTADVRDFVLDTLSEWLPGYTYPVAGPQERCRIVAGSAGRSIDIRMTTVGETDGRSFRISVEVEAL
ncbi:hypothetical protein [Streptomyces sp. NPDC058542]|uniref:hypothetical protein n=1 Tax=Streptomyces sp. NPDC058542 TaxID=3346543 RepID=UPI0036599D8A